MLPMSMQAKEVVCKDSRVGEGPAILVNGSL